ncbi:transcriptional regulator, partial [Pseudomonas aeruginosa]
MQKRTVQRGRPPGTTRFEAEPALAFGKAVRTFRVDQGIAQEELAARGLVNSIVG